MSSAAIIRRLGAGSAITASVHSASTIRIVLIVGARYLRNITTGIVFMPKTNTEPSPGVRSDLALMRMWVMECAFKKNGFPSLGSLGQTTRAVVILPLETWEQLCKEIPELGRRQFEVGSQE